MKLPIEIIQHIFTFTDYKTYMKLKVLNSNFYYLSNTLKFKIDLKVICQRDIVMFLGFLPSVSINDIKFLNWIYPEREYLNIYINTLLKL
jgi:hypothetical protein